MKTNSIKIVAIAFVMLLNITICLSQHKVKRLIKDYSANLKEYKLDNYFYNETKIDNKDGKVRTDNKDKKTIELQFVAYAKKKYKLVFCTSAPQQGIEVNIYNKSQRAKDRKIIYSSEQGIDNMFWSFEPEKAGTYYISYNVPTSLNKKEEFVVMLVGVSNNEQ